MASLTLQSLEEFPLIEPNDDLAAIILQGLERAGWVLEDGDILVLAQKIISKAEGRYAYLDEVPVSHNAKVLAKEIDKDPRLTQLILDESVEVVRKRPGVVIVEHKQGYVHANAGIDQSNIESSIDRPRVLLLPENADASAKSLRDEIRQQTMADVAIIINDSAGRAWRNGTVGMALGTAGFEPVVDLVGAKDLFDRPLETTTVAVADELAAAASFLMGQANEGAPVVVIRGAERPSTECGSGTLIRAKDQDLFR